MPAKPIIEPIDRSNSPATISSAAPTAITPRKPATLPQFTIPSALNMPEPWAPNANSRKTSTAPDNAPDSGRPSRRRHRPPLRRRSSGAAAGEAEGAGAATFVATNGAVDVGMAIAFSQVSVASAVLAGVLLDLADVVLG